MANREAIYFYEKISIFFSRLIMFNLRNFIWGNFGNAGRVKQNHNVLNNLSYPFFIRLASSELIIS